MLHARDDPVDELARRAVEAIDCTETIARGFPGQPPIFEPVRRQDLGALAICLLTLPDVRTLARLAALAGKSPEARGRGHASALVVSVAVRLEAPARAGSGCFRISTSVSTRNSGPARYTSSRGNY